MKILDINTALQLGYAEKASLTETLQKLDLLIKRYQKEHADLQKQQNNIEKAQGQAVAKLRGLSVVEQRVLMQYEAKAAEYSDFQVGSLTTKDMYEVEPVEITGEEGTRIANPKKAELKNDYENLAQMAGNSRTSLDEIKIKLTPEGKQVAASLEETCMFQSKIIAYMSMIGGLIEFQTRITKKKTELEAVIAAKGG